MKSYRSYVYVINKYFYSILKIMKTNGKPIKLNLISALIVFDNRKNAY